MQKFFHDLKTNLLMGLRLALFRACGSHDFVINGDQLVALLMLDLGLTVGFGFLLALPEPAFDLYALPTYCLSQLLFFLLVYLVSRAWRKSGLFMTLTVMTLSATPLLQAFIFGQSYLQNGMPQANPGDYHQLWGLVPPFYGLVILGRAFYIASNQLKAFTAVLLLATLAAGIFQFYFFADTQRFWFTEQPEEDEENKARWAEYKAMDAEKLMYRQPDILASALKALKPQRKRLSDLYFVGFAGFASEDVFSKEVVFAKNLLDSRFDTQGHSINLINHLATRDQVPLANGSNLAATLKQIGASMDKDDDVLMIYMTSHGSKDHRFSVSFWPLALNDITPERLRAMLDESGIKWRIIIISACYSGGFIDALKDDHTLVATAAAADKTSFGCGTESEFTYFGEALFKDMLPHEYSIIPALQAADIAIGQREQQEKIEASLPQLSIGKAIKDKLERLAEDLKGRKH